MAAPVYFHVRKTPPPGTVTVKQLISLRDPVTGNLDYEFYTDTSGDILKVVEQKQYDVYVWGVYQRLIGVSAPFVHYWFYTSAARGMAQGDTDRELGQSVAEFDFRVCRADETGCVSVKRPQDVAFCTTDEPPVPEQTARTDGNGAIKGVSLEEKAYIVLVNGGKDPVKIGLGEPQPQPIKICTRDAVV